MSLLIEAKSIPALIIKLKLMLVTHTDDLGCMVHNVQPAGIDVCSKPQLDCQQAKCYAKADPVLYHRQYTN